MLRFPKRLHRRFPVTILSTVRAFLVVEFYPLVSVPLQFFNRFVQLLSERYLVKLIQNSFVKPLTDAVCLRMLHSRSRVVNVLNREIHLVLAPVRGFRNTPSLCRSESATAERLPPQRTAQLCH